MKVIAFPVLLVLFTVSSCSLGWPQQSNTRSRDFPLAKGAYWIYRGNVRWTIPGTNQMMEKELIWKMEVEEVIERERITGYLMRGHPIDLAWYVEGKKPSEYLILNSRPNRFYRVGLDALKRLKDQNDSLYSLVNADQLILDFPLTHEKKYCPTDQTNRLDDMYCWFVGEEIQTTLTGIKGVSASNAIQEFELSFYTVPDHQIVSFAPGLGITKFIYVHHGTVSDVDVDLIEYHPGIE